MLAIPLYQTWARETRSSECVCLLLCGDIPCKAVPKNARNSPRGSLDMWQCDLQWSAGTSSDIGCTLHLTMCAVLLEWILAISWNPYFSNRRLPCSSKPIWQEVKGRKTILKSQLVHCHEDLRFFFCFCAGDQTHSQIWTGLHSPPVGMSPFILLWNDNNVNSRNTKLYKTLSSGRLRFAGG